MTRSRLSVLVFCLAIVAGYVACRNPAGDSDGFSGIWVMQVGQQTLMVMTLQPAGDMFTGTLERPAKMTTDGLSFSGLSTEVTTARITKTFRKDGTLHIVVQNPNDASDQTEFEMTMATPDRASVVLTGAQFPAWSFVRHRQETPHVSREWDAGRSYEIEQTWIPSNAEMRAITEADQNARKGIQAGQSLSPQTAVEDAERRRRTLALLRNGDLRSGEDFRNAALVLQHGDKPDDFLLAHTLALAALAKKDVSAAWLSAATLDRYLHTIGKPQIYGTQFRGPQLSQQPFDATLVPDSLRSVLRVPAVADQVKASQGATGVGREGAKSPPPRLK